MSSIKLLTQADFKTETAKGICVVDFFAKWCPPCKLLAPILEELDAEYNGKVKIFKLDIEDEEAVSDSFAIHTVPTVIIFKDGKEAKKFIGLKSKEDIKQIIASV